MTIGLFEDHKSFAYFCLDPARKDMKHYIFAHLPSNILFMTCLDIVCFKIRLLLIMYCSKFARQIWGVAAKEWQNRVPGEFQGVRSCNTVRIGDINHQKNSMCIKNLKYPQVDGFKLVYESNFHPCIGRGDKPHSNHQSTFRFRQSPGHLDRQDMHNKVVPHSWL